MASSHPPRHGEGDRARRGGGGSRRSLRPETATARKLRRQMSLPEVLLWQRLRGAQAGVKVRRQHPIGPYVADFYIASARLVIEVDGQSHDVPQRAAFDAMRDQFLKENGYRVLHIRAQEILDGIEQVIEAIVAFADAPLHHQPAAGGPPPRAGEEG
ncbi:MAG: hypothetical protein CMN72_04220 [Sphingomonas sp.]|nr:hypothetical protein [Sphingomonas sp.]